MPIRLLSFPRASWPPHHPGSSFDNSIFSQPPPPFSYYAGSVRPTVLIVGQAALKQLDSPRLPADSGTIASQLRIENILSPEPGFDEGSDTAPSISSTPKRTYDEAFSASTVSSAVLGPAGGFGAATTTGVPPTPYSVSSVGTFAPTTLSPTPSRDSSAPHPQSQPQVPPPPSHAQPLPLHLPPPSPRQQQQQQQQQQQSLQPQSQHYSYPNSRQPPTTQLNALTTVAAVGGGGGPTILRGHTYPPGPLIDYGHPPQDHGFVTPVPVYSHSPRGHGFAIAPTPSDHEPHSSLPPPPPSVAGVMTMVNTADSRKGNAGPKRQPMRSSIACIRCRRSKIKCDNDGKASTPCETCIKSGRECQYPIVINPAPRRAADTQGPINMASPGAVSSVLKRDENSAERGPERKRLRRLDDAFRLEGQSSGAFYAEEVLAAPYLTEAMWMQICDIYRLHFATELPFLHIPTLKENMGAKSRVSQGQRSADTNLVLLGVLTLTSRFHADLVKYVAHSIANQGTTKARPPSTVRPDPWAASEYYADVLTKALGPLSMSMTTASIERVQAFLMLGLYEWSQAKRKTGGLGAWMYVGVAIRMAQALGLCFSSKQSNRHHRGPIAVGVAAGRPGPELRPVSSDADKQIEQRSLRGGTGSNNSPQQDSTRAPESALGTFVENEVRRRTMFSCLILDRLLSCGDERLPAIRSEDLQIRLPCSDFSFDLVQEVRTGYLKPPAGANTTEAEDVANDNNDSVLARFIQLVDIWGEISKYSFSGGRRSEKQPPWEESEFRRLRRLLEGFYDSLPPMFTLSRSNYYRYESHQASSTYVSLHMLGSVCKIMLHREYIPFIPIRCPEPEGPLDEPTFPKGSAPPGFWEESAEQVFKSARDIVDLIEICQGCDKLPMSALAVFSIWTAAFVGIYAWHFPPLDVQRHMLDELDGACATDNKIDVRTYGPTGITYSALTRMSTWLQMACTYVNYFQEMDRFYDGVREDYKRHVAKAQTTGDTGKLSVHLASGGGGLHVWKVHGPKVTNNGTILSEEDALVEASDQSRGSSTPAGLDRSSSTGPEGSSTVMNYTSTYGDSGGGGGGGGSSGSLTAAASDRGAHTPRAAPATSFCPVNEDTAQKEESVATPVMGTPASGGGNVPTFMSRDSGGFSNNSSGGISTHGLPMSVEANMQSWERYPQSSDQSLHLPLQQEDPMASSSQNYQIEDDATCMRPFYDDVNVLPYLARHEGLRWQDASQAAGIEHFSHGDSMEGPAVWTDQQFLFPETPGMVPFMN